MSNPTITNYPEQETVYVDDRQMPSRSSDDWNDPVWRDLWLLPGLTDEALDAMSPLAKGHAIRAYAYNNGYEMYGPDALAYLKGCCLLQVAGIGVDRLTRREIMRLGDVCKLRED